MTLKLKKISAKTSAKSFFIAANLAIFCSTIFCASAQAAENFDKDKIYFGLGYQFNKTDFKTVNVNVSNGSKSYQGDEIFAQNYDGMNFFAGYELDENLDLELGYFRSKNQSQTNNNTGLIWTSNSNQVDVKTASDLEVISLDGVFNHKLTQDKKLKLLGLAGFSLVRLSSKVSYFDSGSVRASESYSDSDSAVNVGFGFEYEILPNVGIRTLAKVTKVSGSGVINYIASYNFGVKYGF